MFECRVFIAADISNMSDGTCLTGTLFHADGWFIIN